MKKICALKFRQNQVLKLRLDLILTVIQNATQEARFVFDEIIVVFYSS